MDNIHNKQENIDKKSKIIGRDYETIEYGDITRASVESGLWGSKVYLHAPRLSNQRIKIFDNIERIRAESIITFINKIISVPLDSITIVKGDLLANSEKVFQKKGDNQSNILSMTNVAVEDLSFPVTSDRNKKRLDFPREEEQQVYRRRHDQEEEQQVDRRRHDQEEEQQVDRRRHDQEEEQQVDRRRHDQEEEQQVEYQSLKPGRPDPHQVVSDFADSFRSERYQQSLQLCDKYLNKYNRAGAFIFAKAVVLQILGKYDESVFYYFKTLKLLIDDDFRLHVFENDINEILETISYYSPETNTGLTFLSKAISLYSFHRYDESIFYFNKVLEITEDDDEKYKEINNRIRMAINLARKS